MFLPSRWDRTRWRVVVTASSVDRLVLYANCSGSSLCGRRFLICCRTSRSKHFIMIGVRATGRKSFRQSGFVEVWTKWPHFFHCVAVLGRLILSKSLIFAFRRPLDGDKLKSSIHSQWNLILVCRLRGGHAERLESCIPGLRH